MDKQLLFMLGLIICICHVSKTRDKANIKKARSVAYSLQSVLSQDRALTVCSHIGTS